MGGPSLYQSSENHVIKLSLRTIFLLPAASCSGSQTSNSNNSTKLKQKTKRFQSVDWGPRWVLLMSKTVGQKSGASVPLMYAGQCCGSGSVWICFKKCTGYFLWENLLFYANLLIFYVKFNYFWRNFVIFILAKYRLSYITYFMLRVNFQMFYVFLYLFRLYFVLYRNISSFFHDIDNYFVVVCDSTFLKNKHVAPTGFMVYFQSANKRWGLVTFLHTRYIITLFLLDNSACLNILDWL